MSDAEYYHAARVEYYHAAQVEYYHAAQVEYYHAAQVEYYHAAQVEYYHAAQVMSVIFFPDLSCTVASGAEERGGGGGGARAQPGHVLIFRHSSRFVLIFTIIVMRKSATHDPKSCVLRPILATIT